MLRINKNTRIQPETEGNYTTTVYSVNPESLKNAYIKFNYDEDLIKELQKPSTKITAEHLKYNYDDVEFMTKMLGYVTHK